MRFISEFELWSPFEIKNYKGLRQKGSAEWLGMDIAKTFGWKERHHVIVSNPDAERHTLEIEAFPMEKWVEFKNKLMGYLTECEEKDELPETIWVLKTIKELESFGKPAETKI
jgi:hypothetical protein